MYPAVPRLVAIGDLHGDLKVTLQALRLAKVIPRHIYPNNVDQISWCGGNTWVVQCGDQIVFVDLIIGRKIVLKI